MTSAKPVITVCSSATFYKHVVELKNQLENMGFTVLVPAMALQMQKDNDYDVTHYKTWLVGSNDYEKKAEYMHGHFDEVARADAILVVNDEKHGVPNYIGGNVLMEMALAFHMHKPIFVFNGLPANTPFDEELRGLLPVVLHGTISNFMEAYTQASTV